MKAINLGILMLFFCAFSIISCDDNDEEGKKVTDYKEYVLTVASEKVPGVLWSEGSNHLSEVYAVKKNSQMNGALLVPLMDLSL